MNGVTAAEPSRLLFDKEEEKRELKKLDFFRKTFLKSCQSKDKKTTMLFKYRNEFSWGPSYYTLSCEAIQADGNSYKKSFGRREFITNYETMPWSPNSDKVCLIGGNLFENMSPPMFNLIVYDVQTESETVLWTHQQIPSFGSWSPSAKYLIAKIYKEGIWREISLINLETKEIVTLGREFPPQPQPFFTFFDEEEQYLLIIDQLYTPVLKVFELPSAKQIFATKIALSMLDSINRVIPEIKEVNPATKEEKAPPKEEKKKTDSESSKEEASEIPDLIEVSRVFKYWDAAILNPTNFTIYLGILRALSWQDSDFYETLEWVKARILFDKKV